MSHDLLQYINSSILVVNKYDTEKFNRVLLPIDDSSGSMKAVKYGIRVALAYKIGIDIVTIIGNGVDTAHGDNLKVTKIIKLIRRSGVDYKHLEEKGDTVEKIIEKANDDKIIVMRASNMNPIKRYFKGSKPLSVMNKCNVPILIVK